MFQLLIKEQEEKGFWEDMNCESLFMSFIRFDNLLIDGAEDFALLNKRNKNGRKGFLNHAFIKTKEYPFGSSGGCFAYIIQTLKFHIIQLHEISPRFKRLHSFSPILSKEHYMSDIKNNIATYITIVNYFNEILTGGHRC